MRTLTYEKDLQWLARLHASLWPDGVGNYTVSLRAHRKLTLAELRTLVDILERHTLMTSMFSSHMFGGYGMHVFQNPVFPGDDPEIILTVFEGHLPINDHWAFILGEDREPPKRALGCGRDDAWDLFSKFTHSPENRRQLEFFGKEPPKYRSYYDY